MYYSSTTDGARDRDPQQHETTPLLPAGEVEDNELRLLEKKRNAFYKGFDALILVIYLVFDTRIIFDTRGAPSFGTRIGRSTATIPSKRIV